MRLSNQLLSELSLLRALTLPLYTPCLLFSLGIGTVVFVFPLFAVELGESIVLAGLILGVKGAGTLLFNLPAGILISKFGEKKVLSIAALLLALTGLSTLFIESVTVLFIASFAMGVATSLWYLARLKYISDHIPLEICGRAMSILSGIEKIGLLLAPLIAGYLITLYGYSLAFQVATAMGLGSLLLIYWFAENKNTNNQHPKVGGLHSIIKALLDGKRLFLVVGSVIVIMLLMRNAMKAMLPVWGLAIELNAAQIGKIAFIAGLVDYLMFIPAGLILDYWGRKWSAVPSFFIFAVGYAALPLANSYFSFLAVAVIIGLANGLSTGWGNTLISDLSPAKQRSEFFAVWRTIGDAGTLSGPLAVSFLASALSLSLASTTIAGVGLLGMLILGVMVKETLRNNPA